MSFEKRRTQNFNFQYSKIDDNLYKQAALNEKVDQLQGVAPEHYANITKSPS